MKARAQSQKSESTHRHWTISVTENATLKGVPVTAYVINPPALSLPEEMDRARLIAAAPEMLEALKLIAKHFQHPEIRKVTGVDSKGAPSTVSIEMVMSTVKRIAAVIEKAEGCSR